MIRDFATVNVPGMPVPKGRPRFGNGRVYTPAETADFETKVGWCGRRAMKGQLPSRNRLRVVIDLYGACTAGDLDNYAKGCLDGLNKIVYRDDKQVDDLHVRRHIDAPDPRAVIVISEIGVRAPEEKS